MPAPGRAVLLVLDAEPVYAAGVAALLPELAVVTEDPHVLVGPLADATGADAGTDVGAGGGGGAGPDLADAPPGQPPSAVMLDAGLADPAGTVALVRAARARWPVPVVLVLRRERPEGLLGLLEAGAPVLLHRRCTPEELVAAVRSAVAGRTWVAPPLAAIVRAEVLAERSGDRSVALSRRELEVLRRLATGASNAAIARSLGISGNTVRNHVHAVLGKLGAENRTDAVALAARRGLVDISG